MAIRTVWIEPVIDRTQTDVDYLKSVALKIITTGFDSLTTDEELFWLLGSEEELSASDDLLGTVDGLQLIVYTRIIKGAWNITDLNRIEQNCKYLLEELTALGYDVNVVLKENTWVEDDFPVLSEIDRIRLNVKLLCDVFLITSDLDFDNKYIDYENANRIEELMSFVYNTLQNLFLGLRYCGTFNCGQTLILP